MLRFRRQIPRYPLLHPTLEVLEVSIRPIHRHAHFRPRLPLHYEPNPAHQRWVSRGQTWHGEGQWARLVRRSSG